MQIDWLTAIAQIINFLVLMWLLKRFLYHPVIRAMDRREAGIAKRIQEAEQREQTAASQAEAYQDKLRDWEQQRIDRLGELDKEIEGRRQQRLEALRVEVDEKSQHWQRQVEQEKAEFLQTLKRQVIDSLQVVSRRTLADLANAPLEAQIVTIFLQRLKTLNEAMREKLAHSGDRVEIITSFQLEPVLRDQLSRAIHETISKDAQVDFRQSPDLLCGIELKVADEQIGWNVRDYLKELEKRMKAGMQVNLPESGEEHAESSTG